MSEVPLYRIHGTLIYVKVCIDGVSGRVGAQMCNLSHAELRLLSLQVARGRETDRQTGRQKDRQAEREKERERETDRQTDRQTDREREIDTERE